LLWFLQRLVIFFLFSITPVCPVVVATHDFVASGFMSDVKKRQGQALTLRNKGASYKF